MLDTPLQLHPATTLRFAQGLPTLHNARVTGPPAQLADAGSIAVIASFATPQTPATVLARVPEAARSRLADFLRELHQRGFLTASETAATADNPLPESLSAMATELHLLAQDAACLPGDQQRGAAELAETTLAAFAALRQELLGRLENQSAQRLQKISADPLQLHLGAGPTRLPGWVAIDASPEAELPLNLDRGLPFADGSVERIYAAHVLEHLYYPGPATALLRECHRVLGRNGRLRLVVPDIEQCLHAYSRQDAQFFSDRRRHWPHWPDDRTPLEDFLAYAGAGPDPSRALDSHKYAYDAETLSKCLRSAGFEQIAICAYMQGEDPELLLDEQSYAGSAEHQQGHYSLFVEAQA